VTGMERSPASFSWSANILSSVFAGADRAGLADIESRVPVADLDDRGLDPVDLLLRDVGLALHVPGHDGRAPVLRDLITVFRVEWRFEVLDRRVSLNGGGDVVDRRSERGIVDGARRALHEHTASVCGSACGKPLLRIWSALRDWPTFASCMLMLFVPTALPIATAATTNASQPNTAVFQWLALQRPIRAARLYERVEGTWRFPFRFGRGPRVVAQARAGR